MSLLTNPDVCGDVGGEFFKAINQAIEILSNDAAQDAYNFLGC